MLSKEKAMDGVRLFVFDMDGTVYLGDQPIEGSIEFIQEVEAAKDSVYRSCPQVSGETLERNSGHDRSAYRP